MNRLFAAYLLLSGLALAGPHRPSIWPLIAVLHFGVAAWLLTRRADASHRLATHRAARVLIAAYPLILMPLLYAELPLLNQSLYGGHYFDDAIIRWERALFGFEPARELAARVPSLAFSESVLAAYVSYYLIIYAPPILIEWKRGDEGLRAAVFALALVFFAHYLFFVWLPVEGPRYRFDSPVPPEARGPVYALAHTLLEAGSSRGAAFPSSHVGVSVIATMICWRWLRPLAPVVGLLTVGLAIGAVYGGFHYGIDAIAGALFGALLGFIAAPLQRRLERRSSAT